MSSWGCLMARGTSHSRRVGSLNFCERCSDPSAARSVLKTTPPSNPQSLQAALLAHISPEPSRYSETLHTIQLASRIHRMRRRKMRVGGGSGGGSGSGSSDENRRMARLRGAGDSGMLSSDCGEQCSGG